MLGLFIVGVGFCSVAQPAGVEEHGTFGRIILYNELLPPRIIFDIAEHGLLRLAIGNHWYNTIWLVVLDVSPGYYGVGKFSGFEEHVTVRHFIVGVGFYRLGSSLALRSMVDLGSSLASRRMAR